MNHTTEPWIVTSVDELGLSIVGANGVWISSPSGNTFGQAIDNTNRIVACVNALAGVLNPEELMDDLQIMIDWIEDSGHECSVTLARKMRKKYQNQ